MCGIIGIVRQSPQTKIVAELCQSLRDLQYRGYDSAGIALVTNTSLKTERKVGSNAIGELTRLKINAACGIGHTRWATHGKASVANAHPHTVGDVAVVHNGIIEDFLQTKKRLVKKGVRFSSETDSELIAHLISHKLKQGKSPRAAFSDAIAKIKGSYAVAAVFKGHSNLILAACLKSPLAVGRTHSKAGATEAAGSMVASDLIGLAGVAEEAFYLKDNQIAELTPHTITVTQTSGNPLTKTPQKTHSGKSVSQSKAPQKTYSRNRKITPRYEPIGAHHRPTKGKYAHFMLKEIFEQPKAISHTFEEKLNLPPKPKSVCIVACGTSHFASMLGRYWLEQYARLDVYVEMASEFRYRYPVFTKDRLYIFISQSGETADTLAALKFAKEQKVPCLAIVNVAHSSLARQAHHKIITRAGSEIGVASTKAFTTQIMALAKIALHYAPRTQQTKIHLAKLKTVGEKIARFYTPARVARLKKMGQKLAGYEHILFLGRGKCYPLAMEAALKTKEISYIHSQAYPAGEMKHGPIALIDNKMPTVMLVPHNELFTKTMANMEEVLSRDGLVFLLSDRAEEVKKIHPKVDIFKMPKTGLFTMPLVYAPAVQLLAYYTALAKGCEIDRPRNLAKSVTVE